MKLYKIKHRFTGEVLFEIGTSSFKLCVEAAVKAGASLVGASLVGASLDRASLDGASLVGASLDGAIKIRKIPIQIIGLRWPVIIFDSHMRIGCEFHPIKEWACFDDNRIKTMDSTAIEFWKTNKESIMSLCRANGRG